MRHFLQVSLRRLPYELAGILMVATWVKCGGPMNEAGAIICGVLIEGYAALKHPL